MVNSSNNNSTLDNQIDGIRSNSSSGALQMVVGNKMNGNKRVAPEHEGSILLDSAHIAKRSKTSNSPSDPTGNAKDGTAESLNRMVEPAQEEPQQQRLDETKKDPQLEERMGVSQTSSEMIDEAETESRSETVDCAPQEEMAGRNTNEEIVVSKEEEENHELAMAVALASLASAAPTIGAPLPPYLQHEEPNEKEEEEPPKNVEESSIHSLEDDAAANSNPEDGDAIQKTPLVSSSSSCGTESIAAATTILGANTKAVTSTNAMEAAPVSPETHNTTQPCEDMSTEPEDHSHGPDEHDDSSSAHSSSMADSRTRRVHFAPGVKPDGGRRRIPRLHPHHHNLIPTLGARMPSWMHHHRGRPYHASRVRMMASAFPPVPGPGLQVHHHQQRWIMASAAAAYPGGEGAAGVSAPPMMWQPPPPSPARRPAVGGAALSSHPEEEKKASEKGNSNNWICDYCRVASFDTFQAACDHEQVCPWRRQPQAPALTTLSTPGTGKNAESSETVKDEETTEKPKSASAVAEEQDLKKNEAQKCSESPNIVSIPLGIAERDSQYLESAQCLIRKQCVEVFCDLASGGKVGVRCQFCKGNVTPGDGRVAHIAALYDVVMQGWYKYHFPCCSAVASSTMPSDIKARLEEHISQEQQQAGKIHDFGADAKTRHYWIGAAQAIGLVNTPSGIRFIRGLPAPASSIVPPPDLNGLDMFMKIGGAPRVGPEGVATTARVMTMKPKIHPQQHLQVVQQLPQPQLGQNVGHEGQYLVFSEDAETVPPYVYFLLRQVEKCHFSEADRFVARSKGPIGFAGFQCRHCRGHAGLGKYFPISAKSLSTNSTSQNVHAHLLKCRHCSPAVKQELLTLKEEKSKAPRLEPGWRKIFFDKIWSRLHESHQKNQKQAATEGQPNSPK